MIELFIFIYSDGYIHIGTIIVTFLRNSFIALYNIIFAHDRIFINNRYILYHILMRAI